MINSGTVVVASIIASGFAASLSSVSGLGYVSPVLFYNSHSVDRRFDLNTGATTLYYNTIGDSGFPMVSWESIVECWMPDSAGHADTSYFNWACDSSFGDKWWPNKDDIFGCGDDTNPTGFQLKDVDGNDAGVIECYIDQTSKKRVIKFPPGYFANDVQVWVPPHTTITGANYPHLPDNTKYSNAAEQQTFFVAMFNLDGNGSSDNGSIRDGITKGYGFDMKFDWSDDNIGFYCHVPDNYPDYWNNDHIWSGQSNGRQWWHVKMLRPGFLMHSDTSIMDVNMLGGDYKRPSENGGLCGGGAIETPGYIDADSDQPEDIAFNGGIQDFHNHRVENVNIWRVRFNDPFGRPGYCDNLGDDCGDIFHMPASQVAIYLAPYEMGTKNVLIHDVVSFTTVADGINAHGNHDGLAIKYSLMMNTGDDCYAYWQHDLYNKYNIPYQITNAYMENNVAVNCGVRQNTQYLYYNMADGAHNLERLDNLYGYGKMYDKDEDTGYGGTCLATFGFNSVDIEGFQCFERSCSPDEKCNEHSNGHAIVFNPAGWFEGLYNGATMTVNNLEWKLFGDNWFYYDSAATEDVDPNDPNMEYAKRKPIAPCLNSEDPGMPCDWQSGNNGVFPTLIWDGTSTSADQL